MGAKSNMDGENLYGKDSGIVATGLYTNGSTIYNIYIEDVKFLKELYKKLQQVIDTESEDYIPNEEMTLKEYLRLNCCC